MVGAGMALTGACPGTVLVQLGTAIPSGRHAMLGGVLGGIIYTFFARAIRRNTPKVPPSASPTLPGRLDISDTKATITFITLCTSTVLATRSLLPPTPHSSPLLDPLSGGLLIGLAQLSTLLLTTSPAGVSSCYEDLGAWLWSRLDYETGLSSSTTHQAPPLSKSIAFAAGIVGSAAFFARYVPGFVLSDASVQIGSARAVFGGLVMVFGARVAGGCTSGHGISGMSMLAMGSLVSVVTMFGGGMGVAALLK